MSKERLEEIKKKYNYERLGEFIDAKPVNPYELKWLIEQAERVELLERENKALNDMLTTLEKQDITKLLNQNVRLIKQNKRYREALEHIERIQSVDVDQQIARQALEGEE